MIIIKLILGLLLLAIAYETWWLTTHREQVARFARDNELIPRQAAANNVLIGVIVAVLGLVALIVYGLVAI